MSSGAKLSYGEQLGAPQSAGNFNGESNDHQADLNSAILARHARLGSWHRGGASLAPHWADAQYPLRRGYGVRAVPLCVPLLWVPVPSLSCTAADQGRVDLGRPPDGVPEVWRRYGRADESFTELKLSWHALAATRHWLLRFDTGSKCGSEQ
jgi:hypothetical protein